MNEITKVKGTSATEIDKIENGSEGANLLIENGEPTWESLTNLNVLFLLAHPDDEQYLAGAIQQSIANGNTCYVAYTTIGKNGTDVRGIITDPDELGAARVAEAQTALATLGVDTGVDSTVYALLQDDNATDVPILLSELTTRLATDNVDIDVMFTFDDVGVYGKNEHYVLQEVGLRYYQETDSVKALYYFTIPVSDVIQSYDLPANTAPDITLGYEPAPIDDTVTHATPDNLVTHQYKLTASQSALKQGVLDIHVTQYEDPTKTQIQNHLAYRPFEYYVQANAKLNNLNIEPSRYIRSIIR